MQRSFGVRSLAALSTAMVALGLTLAATPVAGSAAAAPTTRAGGVATTNLTFTRHGLGTLGGRGSHAEAVSGSVVVGWSETAARETHAFAYDLAADAPVMRDLGTLGGNDSRATDVDGSIVVGTAETDSGAMRAFAYDLAVDEPVMLDLGTLGGSGSQAVAVDGTVVVGVADTASGGDHAFAYDLAAAEPVMRDLGTLGGRSSRAMAVDGSIVVGISATASEQSESQGHAFAYDLAAAAPAMTDLGTLGGRASGATDVDGDLVVGWSGAGARHAFAYDLGENQPVMRNLGALEGHTSSEAAAVDGGVVVGKSYVAGYSLLRNAFAYDMSAPEPASRDFSTLGDARSWATGVSGGVVIGEWRRGWWQARTNHAFAHDLAANDARSLVLGGWRGSRAQDVDADVVVGSQVYGPQRSSATAWVLRETTRPMLAFQRFEQQAKEGAGRVTVRVERYGRTDRAVTVRYRTRSSTAKAGRDFVSTKGVLRFAPGVTSRSFRVKILNDRRAEGHEDLVLLLSRPSKPALLGSPSWTELRITKNDR